jgi:hypothetical protein
LAGVRRPHKSCKSRLVTAADVDLQQLLIGQARIIPLNPAKVLDDPAHLAGCHCHSFVGMTFAL